MNAICTWTVNVNNNSPCVIGIRGAAIERYIYVKKGNNSKTGFFDEIAQCDVDVNDDNIGTVISCCGNVPLLLEDSTEFYSKQSAEFFELGENVFTQWYTKTREYTDLFQSNTFNYLYGTNPFAYRKNLILSKHLDINDKRSIEGDTCDESILTQCRSGWMQLIRKYRNNSLQELDQLEAEVAAKEHLPSDIEDIHTIKQMFRDIPQETDLLQFKTVKELTAFWPSLLLPAPDFVCNGS